ncbi:MAG TPA: hypothetical protein VL069_09355 [Opitutus sp.]|nr:hypothetical protein [Opitutus sp.]
MSDELPPPPLRLKPRPKLQEETARPAPEATPAAGSEPAGGAPSESAPPRLKLRPKLDLANAPAESPVSAPAPTEPVVARPPSISLKPRLSIAEPTTPGEPASTPAPNPPAIGDSTPPAVVTPPPHEPPKFKLKEKAPTAGADTPPAAAPTRRDLPPPPLRVAAPDSPAAVAPAAPKPSTPPSFPVVETTSGQPASTPPPLLQKRAVQIGPEESETADPGQSSLAKIILVVAAVVLAGGAYFGYTKLTESPVDEPQAPLAKVAPARPASPSKTLNEIGAIPAQAIKKAEDVVAAVKANEEAPVEEILVNETVAPLPRKADPKTVEKVVAPVTSTTELSPGLRATTTASVDGDAAPAFRAWVAQVRISGVFQGTPARVLINGKTIPAGEVVDEALGIVFDGVDPQTKTLVFRDSTGATVARKF